MTDDILNRNKYYNYIKNELEDRLLLWTEPNWLVCVPNESTFTEYDLTPVRASSHALKHYGETGSRYTSELFGDGIIYEITGDEPRVITSHMEEDNQNIVSKVFILNEYLITVQEKVVHILLIDGIIENTEKEDEMCLNKLQNFFICTCQQADVFLRSFRCHIPILDQVDEAVFQCTKDISLQIEVGLIQSTLHDIILYFWDVIIKTHTAIIQTNSTFQDLLFRALDFYVGSRAHDKLLWLAKERCKSVDGLASSKIARLRQTSVSPHHLGIPPHYYTPLPAAVVELATLQSVESAIGCLHCINTTLDLIQAQAKEARYNLHQYQNKDDHEFKISESELMGLMTTVLLEAHCSNLVSYIYYMTHFVFSIMDEQDKLWLSLCYLRSSLEQIMKLDLNKLHNITSPVRKELSLQDLMQVSVDMESRFEKPNESQSMNDITALDLQLHQVTQRIQLSTLAQSESQLISRNSSARSSDRSFTSHTSTPSKGQTFVEFLSSLPSTIRASFRRKQCQQKMSLQSSHCELPESLRRQLMKY